MDDNLPFDKDQLQLANYKLSLDNNVMLRMVLCNQLKIMEKLDMSEKFIESVQEIKKSLSPVPFQEPLDYTPLINKSVESLSHLIQRDVWMWVQTNE